MALDRAWCEHYAAMLEARGYAVRDIVGSPTTGGWPDNALILIVERAGHVYYIATTWYADELLASDTGGERSGGDGA